eukprot:TRINITY_DN107210_c0_g1_i1.p2 TRINITY_DN107210_c0_g1~~TRINITY_DN107210_c0_g1_i1.p2  ORF type:complete len:143 (-),score=42.99 TRINITY_DN107210_c0_g1_i1:41-469(-)
MTPQERERYGAPYTFVWHECCRHVAKMVQTKACEKHMTEVQMMVTQKYPEEKDPIKIAQHIRSEYLRVVKVARISNTWNKNLAKIEIFAKDGTTAKAAQLEIFEYLAKKAAGKEKFSPAPKTDLERRIQKAVDKRAAGRDSR